MEFEKKFDAVIDSVKTVKEHQEDAVKKAEAAQKQADEIKEHVEKLEDELAKAKRPDTQSQKDVTITKSDRNAFWRAVAESKGFELDAGKFKAGNMNMGNFANSGSVQAGSSAGEGAIAIVQEMERTILKRLRDEYRLMSLLGSVSVTSVDYKRLVQVTHAGNRWVGENRAATAGGTDGSGNQGGVNLTYTATPTLAEIKAHFGKVLAYSYITDEELTDPAIDLQSFMVNDIVTEMGRSISEAFWRGDGSNKPYGLLSTQNLTDAEGAKPDDGTGPANTGARAHDKFQIIKTGNETGLAALTKAGAKPTAAELKVYAQNVYDKLVDLVTTLKQGYRAGSVWVMNRKTWSEIAKLRDSDGRPLLWNDASNLEDGFDGRLLGYPVVIDDFADDIGANKYPIVFGNFAKAYQMIDYTGMKTLTDQITSPGTTKFYFDKRVGSMMNDNKALKFLKCKN